ncbi:MAG TPA: ABC transporter substrate-binding protein [Candidatus Acidoferrum sp.]|nr:ABC transporter substrate-binding protein [Candidatus Acidoferrum sp.]
MLSRRLRLWTGMAVCMLVGSLLASGPVMAGTPTTGGTLRAALTTSPPTLDPHSATHLAVREIGLHIFESLLTFDAKFQVVPQLAERWEASTDGKVYTFYLRKGVKFHNGKEMTAEDVRASVERFRAMAPRRNELDGLAKLEVVSPSVVRMTLSKPDASFLAAIANPICQLAILPKEAVEGRPINKADIVGTGPYKFVECIPDRWVRVARFADYRPEGKVEPNGFGGARNAYADEIRFIPVPEPGARVAGLQTGEYDFADFLPSASIPQLTGDRSLRIVRLGPQNYPTVYFNHTGKFKNLKLRQAVQAALNMDEIMQVANDGDGRVDPGFYFKEQVWHTAAGGKLYNQKNPARAKQLLEAAGYKGEPVVFVTNSDYDYMYKSAQVIQEQLKKIGMNVKLQVYDWPGSLAVRKDMSKWDLFTSSHSTRFDPSANDFYFRAKTTFMGYSNPKMEVLLDKASAATKFEDRYKIYEEVQKLIYEDVPMLKLYDHFTWQGHSAKLQGYSPWVQVRLWNVWREK